LVDELFLLLVDNMNNQMILSRYIAEAMVLADYEKLDDGTYGGRIPVCPGVIAFAPILAQCQQELQSVLEDWIVLGLKMGHSLPVISHIDLNEIPHLESVDAL
jgi:predicted RNase H-like HicB family nuclease